MLMSDLACSVYLLNMILCSPVVLILSKEFLVALRTEKRMQCGVLGDS